MKHRARIIMILALWSLANLFGADIKNLAWHLVYKGEISRVGLADTPDLLYLDNLDLQFNFTFERDGQARGNFFIYFLNSSGSDPSGDYIGDAQVASNIEANNSTRLFQLLYNQIFRKGKLSILFGLHDLNSEFYTSNYAGLFINSSFGIGPDVSLNAPVSIFNVAALGLRVKYLGPKNWTMLGAVYDGDPGSSDVNRNGLKLDWTSTQGLMSILEIQHSLDSDSRMEIYRFGVWLHSGEFTNFADPIGPALSNNWGIYTSIDRRLNKRIQGFLRGGVAAASRSRVPWHLSLGVNLPGLLQIRPDDIQGIALTVAGINNASPELTAEMIWQITINKQLVLKPDLQYIIHPNGEENRANVLIAGLRFRLAL